MTTAEFAKLIGVSRVTLSKVINGAPGVSPKTAARVRQYIEEYNFAPNSRARSLVGKEEQIIGFFSAYSRQYAGAGKDITSHFATELINLVANKAQESGYKTLVYLTDGDKDVKSIERIFNSKLVRGAILLGYNMGNPDVEKLAQKGYPLVLVNQERDSEYANVAAINMDDKSAASFAIAKLVQYGHKNILYIGCSRLRLPAIRRREGVEAALSTYRDLIEEFTEIDCDFSESRAYSEVYSIYSDRKAKKPTGIFAANDIMAIGAMKALKELGYDIPREVSVVGFDDILMSKYLTPGLTTMRSSFGKMAGVCVDTLLGLIDGKDVERHVELPTEYIERGSLGDAP